MTEGAGLIDPMQEDLAGTGGTTGSTGSTTSPTSSTTSTTSSTTTPAPSPPSLTSSVPTDGATAVAASSTITLTFDQPVSLGIGNIKIANDSDVTSQTISVSAPAGTLAQSVGNTVLTIIPATALLPGKNYHLEVAGTALTSPNGNYAGISDATSLNFSTAPAPPLLSSSVPADGATGVTAGSTITLTFSAPVGLGIGNIIIVNDTNVTTQTINVSAPAGALAQTVSNTVLTITPATALVLGKNYHVEIASTALTSAGGNFAGISDATTLNFSTAAAPPLLTSSIPADGAANVAAGSTIALTFSAAVTLATGNITITNDSDVISQTINVAVPAGALAQSAGNTVVTITPPTALLAGRNYHVEVASTALTSAGGNFAGISDSTTLNFSTAQPPGPCSQPSDEGLPCNDGDACTVGDECTEGVCVGAATACLPPSLVSSVPADNAINVGAGVSTITLTFDRAVTLGTGNIAIVNDTDTATQTIDVAAPAGALAQTAGNTVLTITLSTPLLEGKSYHVTLANTALVGTHGNYAGINDATSLNFTTVPPDTTPDTFVFPPQTGVPPTASRSATTLPLTGLNAPAAISVSGGQYAINGGAPTSALGTVNPGDSVTVYAVASASPGTLVTVNLTIGGLTVPFQVTTGVTKELVVGEQFDEPEFVCEAGGLRLLIGSDYDDDGELNEEEIRRTLYVCDGRNMQASSVPLDPDPERCPNGGIELTIGVPDFRPLTLPPAPVVPVVVEDICNGAHALVRTAALEGDTDCSSGGFRLDTWLDSDADGMLSDGESVISQEICDGDSGLIETTTLAPDAAVCPRGGLRLHAGTDANANGELDEGEVSADHVICHGAGGLVTTRALGPDPEECPTGGIRVDAGTDANADGGLDGEEVESSRKLCNAVLTLSRTLQLEPNVDECAFGGSLVESGLDVDHDGELDDDEVMTRALACSGINSIFRTVTLDVGHEDCPAGGTAVETGIDANANDELDDDEVAETQVLCQPPQLLFETETIPDGDEACPHGGLRILSGHDDGDPRGTPGDDKLQPGEVELEKPACLATTEVLVRGGAGDCSVSLGRRSPSGLLYALLFGALGLVARRRRISARRERRA